MGDRNRGPWAVAVGRSRGPWVVGARATRPYDYDRITPTIHRHRFRNEIRWLWRFEVIHSEMPKKKPSDLNEPVDTYMADPERIDATGIVPGWHLEILNKRLNNLDAEVAGAVTLEEMRKRVAARLG